MHSINGNYSFSYSFSQSSSYSYSSNGAGKQEKLETSSHSEITFESNGKKVSLESNESSQVRQQLENNDQQQNSARRGGRKGHHKLDNDQQQHNSVNRGGRKGRHHANNHHLGFRQGKNTERTMKMVEKVLQKSYARLETKISSSFSSGAVSSQNTSSPVSAYVQIADEKPTAEKVSGNILGFIANKAAQVAAEGGSQEDVDHILDQGLAGFKQGFGEAKEQIGALGLLDENVEADIDQTYNLVLEGVGELRPSSLEGSAGNVVEDTEFPVDDVARLAVEDLSDTVSADIPPATNFENTVNDIAVETTSAKVVEGGNVSVSVDTNENIISNPFADFNFGVQGSQKSSYASYDAIDFQLVTQDGDVVTLNFSDVEAYGQQIDFEVGSGFGGFASQESLSNAFYQNTELSIDVDGELDSDELHAIKDLMNQVRKLAGEFFTGNPQKAFEQALEIGFDVSEIAQYSLNLTAIDVIEVETSYREVANINPFLDDGFPAAEVQKPVNPLKEISGYVEALLDALNQTKEIGEQEFLADAMRSIEATSKLEIINNGETHNINGFADFNEKLLENLPESKSIQV